MPESKNGCHTYLSAAAISFCDDKGKNTACMDIGYWGLYYMDITDIVLDGAYMKARDTYSNARE